MSIRWPLWLLSALVVAGCGVPISPVEITATAESQLRGGEASNSSLSARSSSRGGGSSLQSQLPTAAGTPIAVLEGPDTGPAELEARLVDEPAASEEPDSEVTATPEPFDPSEVSQTPDASPTLETTASLTPTPSTTAEAATSTPEVALQAALADDFSSEVVRLVNEIRAENGLAALQIDTNLTAAAQGYAELMAENNYFGHTGPYGSTPNSRMVAAGYLDGCRGEALSAGQSTPAAVVKAWLNSGQHRAILLEPAAQDVGVGYAYKAGSTYRHYWSFDTGPADWVCS